MLLWLTWGVRTINKLLRIQDETDPDTILMFSRPGGYGTEKARQLLGYFPKVNLTEGMRRSEIWLRSIGENINSKS
jgi:nucleoside-diphosphate-sugar epimerase